MPSFTRPRRRVPIAAMLGLLLAAVSSGGRAETPAPPGAPAAPDRPGVSFTTATPGFDFRYLVLGWVFRPNTALLVDALGYYDYTGAGLKVAHTVGIFNDQGVLVAAATVAPGTREPLIGSFRYAPIPPVTLAAGRVYTLAATADFYGNPNGYDLWGRDVVDLASDPSITLPAGAGRYEFRTKDGLVDPAQAEGTNLYAGPNFLLRPPAP